MAVAADAPVNSGSPACGPELSDVRVWAGEDAVAPYSLALLRARRERPRSRRAGEQRDELSPHHSITSSARARNVSGMLKPIPLAALRLTISSNLVGCSTGRSAGFAPLKILSTKIAARR